MAKRDSSAVRIYSIGVESSLLNDGQRLRGESFIQFDHRNIFQLQTGEFQSLRDGIYWTDAELFRQASGGGVSDESRERRQAQGFRSQIAHDNDGSGAIAHRRTITGGDRAFDVKRGFQFGERFERSVGTRQFIGVENKGLCRRLLRLAFRGSAVSIC